MNMFKGSFPAVVTPFSENGEKLDISSLENLINYLINEGSSGLVIAGSTGEASTLSDEEFQSLINHAIDLVKKRVPIIAGIGANNTLRARDIAAWLEGVKVDGLLVVTPPYNKPSQDGLYAHFSAISENTKLPIIAYNVPSRTGVSISPSTVGRLWKEKKIVGIKDATGSLDQALDIIRETDRGFSLLSGEDSIVHPIMASGGVGVISASANIIPKKFADLTSAALKFDYEESLQIQLSILPLVRAMFMETNPIPVKTSLYLKKIIKYPTLRLPLLPAKEETKNKLMDLLR